MTPTARSPLLALAASATVLAGCPIPQPLPGVGNIDAGVAPPRILVDATHPGGTFVPYDDAPGACDGGARFLLQATVVDQTPDDQVEGRWFIDYDPSSTPRSTPLQPFVFPVVLPDHTSYAASFSFAPVADGYSVVPVQVVELVVSNGFAATTPDGGLPNKTPLPGYETQVYRWVFQPAPGSAACGP